jgi:hypothetical protein
MLLTSTVLLLVLLEIVSSDWSNFASYEPNTYAIPLIRMSFARLVSYRYFQFSITFQFYLLIVRPGSFTYVLVDFPPQSTIQNSSRFSATEVTSKMEAQRQRPTHTQCNSQFAVASKQTTKTLGPSQEVSQRETRKRDEKERRISWKTKPYTVNVWPKFCDT